MASLFMKPVGGLVHLRRGTVHRALVRYLCIGSVPAAFLGAVVLKSLGSLGSGVESVVKTALGAALLLAVATMVAKGLYELRRHSDGARGRNRMPRDPSFPVRLFVTVAIGIVGGLVVGMTSVGSGSLIIIALLVVYPQLTTRELVGTDLVQAVPLVASAALGHVLFGSVQMDVTASLLVRAIPCTWLGARLSSRAPQMIVRRMLAMGAAPLEGRQAAIGIAPLA